MVAAASTPNCSRQRGASLIEVLVTLVIVAFGLLGIVGMQARLQVSEMEAYQRSQALLNQSNNHYNESDRQKSFYFYRYSISYSLMMYEHLYTVYCVLSV